MSGVILEDSNYSKLQTDAVYLPALRKLDDFLAAQPPGPEYERDPGTGVLRKSLTPGCLVSAPVHVKNKQFYWPGIVEFAPEPESDYVRTVRRPDGPGDVRAYFVTLITIDRSSWFGSWVPREDLRPFNVLTEPEGNDAAHVPDSEVVFNYVKEHLFLTSRDRLLKLSFMSFMGRHGNLRRWEIRY